MIKSLSLLLCSCALALFACNSNHTTATEKAAADTAKITSTRDVWPAEKAKEWYAKLPWMAGSDFIPSTAINQLEMWQAASFDTATINRELGYAEGIGMSVMRVYLHHLAWETDPEGFKQRMDKYLSIADAHHIKTVFVFFDDCWNNTYAPGEQPAPKTGVHNSGWVQDPGKLLDMNPGAVDMLEKYVKDVLTRFKDDNRIVLWDLYNEPGNSDYKNKSLPLLKKVFTWGREVNPVQPLSAGVWRLDLTDLNKFQLENSDIVSYHNYMDLKEHQRWLDSFLLKTGRPLFCTEYMARTRNSTFATILPMLKAHKIVAINWGLVDGKTNTKYAWDTPLKDGREPATWFHDIFHKDGTPYRPEETTLIKKLTMEK